MKKKVGQLYGKPIVEGDVNIINDHEILLRKKDKDTLSLAKKTEQGIVTSYTPSLREDDIVSTTLGQTYVPIYDEDGDVSYMIGTDIWIEVLNSLQDVFSSIGNLYIYNDEISCNAPYGYLTAACYYLLNLDEFHSKEGSWDKEDIKKLILENISTAASRETDVAYVSTLECKHNVCWVWVSLPGVSYFKDGILTKNVSSDSSYIQFSPVTNIILKNNPQEVNNKNFKGEETKSLFKLLGSNSITTTPPEDIDESYVAIQTEYLLMHPLLNGLFTLGTLNGTDTIVIVKCLDLDLSDLRKMFHIPESRVIPSGKEGDYWIYPNQSASVIASESTQSLDDPMTTFKTMMLGHLKTRVAALEKELGIDDTDIDTEMPEEEGKAVVD